MNLLLIGVNHKTAPLNVRERFSFTGKQLEAALSEIGEIDSVLGTVILSTCNRTEVYTRMIDINFGMEDIKGYLFDYYEIGQNELNRYFYILKNEDALTHLFRVASGLDSQVLGETQILGQVKTAMGTARDIGVIDVLLDEVFQKAVDVGKMVRRETKISQGNISLGSIAIKVIERKFNDLQDRLVLIVGAGKIAALISDYLKQKRIKGIFVSNRTYMKARELARNCGGEAVNFSHLIENLRRVDIVISSTSSPHLILGKKVLAEAMKMREKPLLIMDLALPRDVTPEAREIPGIFLYDLDDLKSIVDENYNKRVREAKFAEAIIQREMDGFLCKQLESVQGAAL